MQKDVPDKVLFRYKETRGYPRMVIPRLFRLLVCWILDHSYAWDSSAGSHGGWGFGNCIRCGKRARNDRRGLN